MLQQPRLLGNLQQFCDTGYSAFRHFPPSRTDARSEWAHAFADYVSVIEENITRPPTHGLIASMNVTVGTTTSGNMISVR